MTVAVVFIGTEKYLDFLPSWYERCEENLLPGVDKKYLVFTDGDIPEAPDNAVIYKQEHLEWPYITLYRFKIIEKALEEISKCEWLIFLDADMAVVDKVTSEEVFSDKPYLGVHHPCHFLKFQPHHKPPGSFETNPLSTAKVPNDYDFSVYWQGCLWGGKVPYVFELIDELQNRTNDDLKDDIIAVWHDESHLNKFFIENKERVHTLPSSYAYPEDFADACDFEAKIVHLSKNNSNYHI